MDKRYKPIALVAGGLFMVSVIANLVARLAYQHDDNAKSNLGLVGWVIIGVTFIVMGYRWAVRYPTTRAIGEILLTWGLACGGSVLIAPFAGLTYPGASGPGDFFLGVWVYGAVGLGGALLGYVAAIGLSRDYRSQALKRMASTSAARPRRAVKR